MVLGRYVAPIASPHARICAVYQSTYSTDALTSVADQNRDLAAVGYPYTTDSLAHVFQSGSFSIPTLSVPGEPAQKLGSAVDVFGYYRVIERGRDTHFTFKSLLSRDTAVIGLPGAVPLNSQSSGSVHVWKKGEAGCGKRLPRVCSIFALLWFIAVVDGNCKLSYSQSQMTSS